MYLLCMIKARIRWCTCRVENILTLGKLLSLWFCFLLHSIFFFISQTSYRTYKIISSYELARPIMGTIFLVIPVLLVGFYRTLLTLSMRAFGPRISAYAFWTTTDIHTDIHYISREISIEHPSVGFASLAQLSASEASHSLGCSMINRAIYMVVSVRTYKMQAVISPNSSFAHRL